MAEQKVRGGASRSNGKAAAPAAISSFGPEENENQTGEDLLMRVSVRLYRCALVALVLMLSLARTAKADTYALYNLGDDNGRNLIGITASGAVVTSHPCGAYSADTCYSTFVDGVEVSDAATAPPLSYDDGTACGGPAGYSAVGGAVCNNGWTAFYNFYGSNGDPNGVYVGTSTNLTDVGVLADRGGDLNAAGDFAFVNGRDEWFYEAVDLSTASTPEPSSLFLLGSGALSVVGVVRRRMRSQAKRA